MGNLHLMEHNKNPAPATTGNGMQEIKKFYKVIIP